MYGLLEFFNHSHLITFIRLLDKKFKFVFNRYNCSFFTIG